MHIISRWLLFTRKSFWKSKNRYSYQHHYGTHDEEVDPPRPNPARVNRCQVQTVKLNTFICYKIFWRPYNIFIAMWTLSRFGHIEIKKNHLLFGIYFIKICVNRQCLRTKHVSRRHAHRGCCIYESWIHKTKNTIICRKNITCIFELKDVAIKFHHKVQWSFTSSIIYLSKKRCSWLSCCCRCRLCPK